MKISQDKKNKVIIVGSVMKFPVWLKPLMCALVSFSQRVKLRSKVSGSGWLCQGASARLNDNSNNMVPVEEGTMTL